MNMNINQEYAVQRLGALPTVKQAFGAMPLNMPEIEMPTMQARPAQAQPMPQQEAEAEQPVSAAKKQFLALRERGVIDENGMTPDGRMFRGGDQTRFFVASNGGREYVMKDKELMAQLNKITLAENRAFAGLSLEAEETPKNEAQQKIWGEMPERLKAQNLPPELWDRFNGMLRGEVKASPEELKMAAEIVLPQFSGRAMKRENAEEKRKKAMEAQVRSIEDAHDTATSALNTIQKLRANLADGFFPETGLAGKALSFIPGFDAYNLERDLASLKGIIGLQSLMQAKAGSANGASGFGALSEKELALLQNKLGALDAGMGKERLLEALGEIAPLFQRALLRRELDNSELEEVPAYAPQRYRFTADGQLLGGGS